MHVLCYAWWKSILATATWSTVIHKDLVCFLLERFKAVSQTFLDSFMLRRTLWDEKKWEMLSGKKNHAERIHLESLNFPKRIWSYITCERRVKYAACGQLRQVSRWLVWGAVCLQPSTQGVHRDTQQCPAAPTTGAHSPQGVQCEGLARGSYRLIFRTTSRRAAAGGVQLDACMPGEGMLEEGSGI